MKSHLTRRIELDSNPAKFEKLIVYIAAFAKHFGKSPELLGLEEIRAYQIYLVNARHISWSTLNICVATLRFLYHVALRKDWDIRHIPYAKRGRKLPIVLSQYELAQFFQAISSFEVSRNFNDGLCGWVTIGRGRRAACQRY